MHILFEDVLDPTNTLSSNNEKSPSLQVLSLIRSNAKLTGKWSGFAPNALPMRLVLLIMHVSLFKVYPHMNGGYTYVPNVFGIDLIINCNNGIMSVLAVIQCIPTLQFSL